MALQKTPLTSSPAHAPVLPAAAVKPAVGKKSPFNKNAPGTKAFWVGLGASVSWASLVIGVVSMTGSGGGVAGVSLTELALAVSSIVSPVAMIWMITAYMQRASDIHSVVDPLRRQLTLITGESGAADARIRRFNEAIREQIDLLRSAQNISQEDFEAVMDRVQQYRADFERFENVSSQQVKEIQDIVRRTMFQVEQMMDDKFTMLRVIDGKMQQNSAGVAERVEEIGSRVNKMLECIEESCAQVTDALERAQRDSQKLADTSRLQESSLTNAAAAAAETLGGLSSKIDLSVAHFLERASSAREEAERVAHAIDAQTRTLDDFSATLPSRVAEAESVLRGVADRLYASEQYAREQADSLGQRLAQQVDGMQDVMDRFVQRLSSFDGSLDMRRNDLTALADRIGLTASGFFTSWEQSVDALNDRMGNSLLRFTVVNDETRRNAETVTQNMNESTSKYEDVVVRMRALSEESGDRMKSLVEDITSHVAQFEKLNIASTQAGQEVQSRAEAALKNLQAVLERVVGVRNATQDVGHTLVKDISDALAQSEKMIQRLGEAAQLGARAIGAATEGLGRQESELLGKARASEAVLMESIQKLQRQAETAGKGLRDQASNLMNLLAEAQGQLSTTDQKLQTFATQAIAPVQKAMEKIDASTEQGLRTLNAFGEGLSQQVDRMQDFHSRIGSMSKEISQSTSESAGVFETLSDRFASVRAAQEESARHMLTQFTEVSESLQREVSGLDSHTTQAVELLQKAAMSIGEQSYQMMEKAKSSGSHIKEVAASLQAEAAQIQSVIHQQTEKIGSELSAAERKFSALGDVIHEKSTAVHALLDRTVDRYNDVSEDLGKNITLAHGKIENLHIALEKETNQISCDAVRIEKHAGDIVSKSTQAVETLSILKDSMAATHDKTVTYGQQTINKITEVTTALQNSATAVQISANAASETVVKSTDVFDQRANKLVDGGQQIVGVLTQLTTATDSLVEKAATIRSEMDKQNNRLLMQLSDSVSQLDVTGNELQHIVSAAAQGADRAATRFAEMTETAGMRIGGATQELESMAKRAEDTLASLGANVTQQAATLAVVGDQIGEQQKQLAEASEKQRAQMLELFDKLNAAHTQASEVAEKSIETLSKSLGEIDRQVAEVGTHSQEAVGAVKIASAGFSDQSVLLLQNAQAAEQQARSVLQATSALQEQAGKLRESLQLESQRASESLETLLGRLTKGGTEVRTLGADTSGMFTALQQAFSQQTGELNGAMDKISERQKTLTAALDAQREMINILLNRLTSAQDQTACVAERAVTRLTEGAQQITKSVEAIDARAQEALNAVQKASSGFAYEAEAIEKHATQAVEQSREVLSSASNMREQIGSLRDVMRESGDTAKMTLESLIERVKTGTDDLRQTTVLTENSLKGLNDNLAEQNATLTTSMQTINERQTSLATALDAQRETISGLLSRFAQAQEETVSVAERTASRINEEAQSITNSIDLIGAQASTTLGNVQASVTGFAEQAVAIKMHSQEAEQQVRSVMSVSTSMQEQAKQMREAMQSETARVAELLSNVIDKIDEAGRQLKQNSADAATSLDTTAQRFSDVTQTGADRFSEQMRTVGEAIDKTEARIVEAGDKMKDNANKIAEAGEKADAQTHQLANAAEFAVTRLSSLRDAISETDKAGRDIAVTSYTRIDEVKAALQEQLQRLTDFSKTIVDQVGDAANTLSSESNALRANLASSESALTAAADFVRAEIKQIPTVLTRTVADIENVTNTLKTQTEETDRTLVGTADRFIAVTGSVRDNMAEEMKRVGTVADDAGKILNGFNQLLAEQVAAMRQNTALLSGEQQDLVEKASQGIGSLSEASQRLLALRTEATSTAERLVREFDILDQRAAATGGRLAQAGEGIAKQIIAISDATANAEERISGAGDTLRDQLDRIRGGLQSQIDDISRGLLQITAQLERTGTNLRSAAVGAVADVERVGQRFEQTGAAASAQVAAETDRMRKAADAVAAILGSFGEKFDQMIDHMSQAGADIKYQEGGTIEHLQRMLGHLGTVAEKLEAARAMSGDVTHSAIERLDEVVTAVQTQMGKLTAGTQTAAGIMRGIGQIYSDQTGALTKGVNEAHTQVLTMNKSIEDMQQRTDRMRAALKLQGEDLMNSLRQILTQLEMTGDGLTEAVNRTLMQQAASGTKRIN